MAEQVHSYAVKNGASDHRARPGSDEREVKSDTCAQRRSSRLMPKPQANARLSANEESDSEREKKRQRAMNAIESRKKRARRKAFVGNLESQYKLLAAEKAVLLRQSLLLQSALSEATRIARLVDLEIASNRVTPSLNSFGFQLGSSCELLPSRVQNRPLGKAVIGFEPSGQQSRISHPLHYLGSSIGSGGASSISPPVPLNNFPHPTRLLWHRLQAPMIAPGVQRADFPETQSDHLSTESEIRRLLRALQR